jgi:hypothetical protein
MPFEIKDIQTDNESEFLSKFTKALKKKEIKHYLTIQDIQKDKHM